MQQLLKGAIRIAQTAGKKILEVYNGPDFEKNVEQKGDLSPLTLADKKAHIAIAAGLKRLSPEIPVLSEEGKKMEYADRKGWTTFWLVDPLDGTKEFIKRNGEFAVHIALVVDGRAVLGVVHLPVLGVTYYSLEGEGSFKMENKVKTRISVALFSKSQANLRMVASRSHMSPETTDYIAQFATPTMLSMGSSMKFMLVADGRADIYPRLGPTMEWDTAAPQVIVEGAGGTVLHAETGLPLTYNKENLLNPYFIVSGAIQ